MFSVAWHDENALVLMINTQAPVDGQGAIGRGRGDASSGSQRENSELNAILDTATDGVLVLDRAGRVLSANRSAAALFGYDAGEIAELSLGDLFAPESKPPRARLSRPAGARQRPRACSTPAARRSAACGRAGWCRSS